MVNLTAFAKQHLHLLKMRHVHFPMAFLKITLYLALGIFNLQEVSARNSNANILFNTLEDQNQDLPKTKSLLPTTEFHYETESHVLRIPRYMAYLLQNEKFLKQFPEYKTLVPNFDKVITAANGHDIEKMPKHIYTQLAHDKGVNYDKLPQEEAVKAKAFRAAFNADGEAKMGKIMKSIGFMDESGELTKSGKLFYTLEAFVDRWDAYKFRAQEFGKKMLRPGDYVRQVLKPSGFSTDHYNVDDVAKMDDFVNEPKNNVNMEKAVGRFTPQAYKRIRSHFRGGDPAFQDIQQEQANKLVAEHNTKVQTENFIKKPGVSANAEAESRSALKEAGTEEIKAVATEASKAKIAIGRAMEVGIAGAVAHSIHDATDPKKELGEAVDSAALSTWNLGSTLATGGLANVSTIGDEWAKYYSDPKVYAEFLNLPLDEQEMIMKGKLSLPFRTVIFSQRPRITQIQCPAPKANNSTAQQEPFEFDIYSSERKKIHMKIFSDNNKPMYIVSKLASPFSSEDDAIRLSLQSQQACFSLPQYSQDQHSLITKNKCTSINSKGRPNLEPEMAQHLSPDFWEETVKAHDWTLKYLSQLQDCCKSDKCLKIMNDGKNIAAENDGKTIVKKSAGPIIGAQ